MMRVVFLITLLAVAYALPADRVLLKPAGLRYQYVEAGDGTPHLADMWLKTSDLKEAARFDPSSSSCPFPTQNPTVSQPLLMGVEGLLGITNYNSQRRTVVLLHGWLDSVTADVISVLVPAFLSAEDVNVIVADWSAGAATINYFTAVANTVPAGVSAANFLNWLNDVTGAVPTMYHLVGHSLGGHMAGVVGRHMGGKVAYITALDPMLIGWTSNDDRFQSTDGHYTEVIHTNAGQMGIITPIGDADFYPNGGLNMPGCGNNDCDHARSYFYLAESLTSGGFTGKRCASYITAMTGNCILFGSLKMGGLTPKTGSSGIFYLETNAQPPFSRG